MTAVSGAMELAEAKWGCCHFCGVRDRLAGLLVPLAGSELFQLYPGLSRSVVSIRVSKIS